MSWSRSTIAVATPAATTVIDEQALRGLDPGADAGQLQRSAAYFERLTESRDAWEACAEAILQVKEPVYQDDQADRVQFFCFKVLEHRVRNGHAGLTPSQHELLRNALMTWLRRQAADDSGHHLPEAAPPPCVRNKAAQVLALTFVAEYPALWPSFFSDVAALALRPRGVDMYLRTLAAIGAELAGNVPRSPEETRRVAALRAAMWDGCVPGLAESWFQILSVYGPQPAAGSSSHRSHRHQPHPELARRCLDVVASFVSWIDLDLVANERFVGLLLAHMLPRDSATRGEACDCLREMIARGTDPAYKTRMAESLCRLLHTAGLFSVEHNDVAFLVKFSRLVGSMGLALVLSWTKLVKLSGVQAGEETLRVMESGLVPPALALLLHHDRDVSSNAVPFLCDYLHLLRQLPPVPPPLTERRVATVREFSLAVGMKLAYDTDHNNYDVEDDNEDLVDYWKQLKALFDRVVHLSPDTAVWATRHLFTATVPGWRASVPWAKTEAALRLLCMLGKALPAASPHARFSKDDATVSILQEMMQTLLSCGMSGHPHPAVSLAFLEAAVYHTGFFAAEPRRIPDVLLAFLDNGRGGALRSPSPRVRGAAACLFARFARAQREHLTGYAENVLAGMRDLLELAGGPTPVDGDNAERQLCLYEAAGVLVASVAVPERMQALLRSLLSPLTDAFATQLTRLPQEVAPERQAALAAHLVHAVGLAGRASKGFFVEPVRQRCCIELYRDCLHVFLPALASCPVQQRVPLRAAVRSFLRRMVDCLEEEALPFVAAAAEPLLLTGGDCCEDADLQDFVPLLAQLAVKFRERVSPFLRQVFAPLVAAVFGALARPTVEDEGCERTVALRRSYFSFIHTVVVEVPRGANDILAEQGADAVRQVLHTLIQGAAGDSPEDPTAQRICFIVLARLTELWGGGGHFPPDFLYQQVVPACFTAPLRPAFDPSARAGDAVLSEVALALRAVAQTARGGADLARFLTQELHVPLQPAQELLGALQQPNIKVLKSAVKDFFQRARNINKY